MTRQMTADELLGFCKKAQAEGSFCATYIAGFLDGVYFGHFGEACPPTGFSDAHMLRAVTQQLMREHQLSTSSLRS
jgi:hypothetical protein